MCLYMCVFVCVYVFVSMCGRSALVSVYVCGKGGV